MGKSCIESITATTHKGEDGITLHFNPFANYTITHPYATWTCVWEKCDTCHQQHLIALFIDMSFISFNKEQLLWLSNYQEFKVRDSVNMRFTGYIVLNLLKHIRVTHLFKTVHANTMYTLNKRTHFSLCLGLKVVQLLSPRFGKLWIVSPDYLINKAFANTLVRSGTYLPVPEGQWRGNPALIKLRGNTAIQGPSLSDDDFLLARKTYRDNLVNPGNAILTKILTNQMKTTVARGARNSKSENMTSSGENGLNIRTNASLKWDRTYCPAE